MNKEREALRMALEALRKAKRQIVHANIAPHGCIGEAITAIQEALAQPDHVEGTLTMVQPAEQEPVGQLQEEAYGRGQVLWFKKLADQSLLFTSPPKRKWVGLTDDERAECWSSSAKQSAINIEAKLKELNHE